MYVLQLEMAGSIAFVEVVTEGTKLQENNMFMGLQTTR